MEFRAWNGLYGNFIFTGRNRIFKNILQKTTVFMNCKDSFNFTEKYFMQYERLK